MIPKTIYTYWDSAPIPALVTKCVNSWKLHNKGFEIKVLSKSQVKKEVSPPAFFDDLIPQHQADWVRLKYLSMFGGVWMDASIFAFQATTSWVNFKDAELHLFVTDDLQKKLHHLGNFVLGNFGCGEYTIIENWAFACPANHDFVTKWLKHTEIIFEFGHEIYLKKMGLMMPKCFLHKYVLPYFNTFLASSVVYHSPSIYKRDPIKLLSTCLGTVCRPAYHYLWTPIDQIPEKTLFWKMSSVHRKYFFPFFKKRGMYRPGSISAVVFDMPANPWKGRLRFAGEIFLLYLILSLILKSIK